jgi:hypothetical protein
MLAVAAFASRRPGGPVSAMTISAGIRKSASGRTRPAAAASSAACHQRPRVADRQAGMASARYSDSAYPTIRKIAAGITSRYITAARPPDSRARETTAKQPATADTASPDSTQSRRTRWAAATATG